MRHLRHLAAAAALFLSACGGDDPFGINPAGVQFESARQRWSAGQPEQYQFNYTRVCFCAVVHEVRVTVTNGVVTSAVVVESGQPLAGAALAQIPTIDDLFETVRDALARNAHDLRVTYDATRGFPTQIIVDYREMVADDEFLHTVREFGDTRLSSSR